MDYDTLTTTKFTIYLADGSGVRIGYKGHDWYYCIKVKYLNDWKKYNGSKCFLFGFYPTWTSSTQSHLVSTYVNKGIEPYVGSMKTDEDGNRVETTMDDLYTSEWYAKAIQLNNWTIPDDYPVRY